MSSPRRLNREKIKPQRYTHSCNICDISESRIPRSKILSSTPKKNTPKRTSTTKYTLNGAKVVQKMSDATDRSTYMHSSLYILRWFVVYFTNIRSKVD